MPEDNGERAELNPEARRAEGFNAARSPLSEGICQNRSSIICRSCATVAGVIVVNHFSTLH